MPLVPYSPSVSLVSITSPRIGSEAATPEDIISYCARVSNPSKQLEFETSARLLRYCIKHHHWSIFEMVDMTVEIETSRAIAAQILRHKSASFQEMSQRYMEAQTIYLPELRTPHMTNRQKSEEPSDLDTQIRFAELSVEVETFLAQSNELYNRLIDNGVARECARAILPLNTKTVIEMKMNVRSWIHYLQVRCGNGTQKEHQQVARLILAIFKEQFPTVYEALQDTIPSE